MKGAAYGAAAGAVGAVGGVAAVGAFVAGTAAATNAILEAHGALAAGTYVGPSTRSACFASALERLRQSLEEVQGESLVLHNERDFTRYLLYKKVGMIP